MKVIFEKLDILLNFSLFGLIFRLFIIIWLGIIYSYSHFNFQKKNSKTEKPIKKQKQTQKSKIFHFQNPAA